MRYLLTAALAVFIMTLPELSFCAADVQTVSEKLCEVRQMICGGGAGIGLVTLVVLGIGFMIFVGKVNWPFVMIMSACMIVYFSADQITTNLFGLEEIDCPCSE